MPAAGLIGYTLAGLIYRLILCMQNAGGLAATINQPVRQYLAAHTAQLPVSAGIAITVWQAVGVGAFVLGILRATGARLIWTGWGAATALMVWAGTPASGRPVAVGFAVLAWAVLSAPVLRGLSLAPTLRMQADVYGDAPLALDIHTEVYQAQPGPCTHMPYPVPPQLPPSLN
ncbi:hypothetical protein [Streptomyces sp. NPDC020298]|uniref:hypothetical protein n=1 Tax=unclassified Streptomyces TaxID=2593676 RepID=UPI0033EFB511